jgi:TRAP-type mannitol/chloroaromatic compound transport system permease small subunit
MYGRMPPRGRAAVDLAGHLALAGPFLFVSLPAAWSFAMTAWVRGEGSRNDGLNDLWLVKSTLPLGLALLALVLVIEMVRLVRILARR